MNDIHASRHLDLDAHLMIPARRMPDVLGEPGERLAAMVAANPVLTAFFDPEQEHPLEDATIWHQKGAAAPGAFDPHTRLRALDVQGISRQLVFPQVITAIAVWNGGDDSARTARRHNDFICDWASADPDRLRPVALLPDGTDVDALVSEIERSAARGARAFLFPHGRPIAGRSPAHPDIDPVWAALTHAEAAACIHIGGELDLLGSPVWGDTDLLRAAGHSQGEPVGPHLLGTLDIGPQNWLATMVFGGVFERHPRLRFGAIELGAAWIGPLAEALDLRLALSGRLRQALPLSPSEYIRRNVRVTPFVFEPLGMFIDRYDLDEVYAYSTDYPHPEGGTDPIGSFNAQLDTADAAVRERFFSLNGDLLLPD